MHRRRIASSDPVRDDDEAASARFGGLDQPHAFGQQSRFTRRRGADGQRGAQVQRAGEHLGPGRRADGQALAGHQAGVERRLALIHHAIDPDALTGGTFTISNLGMFGIDAFTPILNLPECAILGVGRIVAKPVVIDEDTEEIAVRRILTLSLTFDHRIVDGAPAARFLQTLSGMIERPFTWLLR